MLNADRSDFVVPCPAIPMRSRAVRLSIASLAWIAIAVAGAFLVRSERNISSLRSAARAFDRRAREATDALADLRVAQQAYVAAGQGADFWVPKVAETAQAVDASLASLRGGATSPAAQAAVAAAAASFADFASIDARVRDYLNAEQPLMAGDVIFTEGGQTVTAVSRQVEAARMAEHQAADAAEATERPAS